MKRTAAVLILCMALLSPANALATGDIDAVRAKVLAWGRAWQSQDIDDYMSFYSRAFQSKGIDYKGWREKKSEVFKQSSSIQVEISDLWVFIEGNYATASFVQRYQDRTISDFGKKMLILVNSGGAWQIVSEEWTPLAVPDGQEKGAAEQGIVAEVKTTAQKVHQKAPGIEDQDSSTGKTVVKNIRFKIEKDLEKVFVGLNKYCIPRVLTLEGDKPRIVLDIMNVAFWQGPSRISVNGKLIQQIRTYLHREIEKLRIVLDLNPAKDYTVDQTFYQAENIYCITVQ